MTTTKTTKTTTATASKTRARSKRAAATTPTVGTRLARRPLAMATIALAAAASCGIAEADVNLGVLASSTGPGAAIGVDVVRSADLFRDTKPMAGSQKVNVFVLDDASDSTTGVVNMKRLITEQHIDAVVGSNTTGPALAMAQVAAEAGVPMIAIAPIDLRIASSPWVFRASQSPELMVQTIVNDMAKNKISTVSYIGFADAWGDSLFKGLTAQAPDAGIKILAEERFKRPDTSVTAQTLRILAPQPQAIFIGAAGTPAMVPQVALNERGFKGPIYQNAIASKDFIRVGGKQVEGALVPVGQIMVNEQLADTNLAKPKGKQFLGAYEGKYGPDSRSMFAGYAWDSLEMFRGAAATAVAKGLQPGTPEFRDVLRNAFESANYVGATGRYAFTPTDHGGLSLDSLVMVRLENGKWMLVK